MNNGQNENDTLVSTTYRDLAQESTPPALDDSVLRMAAQSKPAVARRGIPMWMKPVAWAATLGLTLAIVLDVTDVGQSIPASTTVAPAASIQEAFSADDADVVQEAEEMARLRDGPDQGAELAKSRQEPAHRVDEAVAGRAVESQAYAASPATEQRAAALDLSAEKKELSDDPACSVASREEAATWYDCVLKLRNDDSTAEADREMLLLIEAFPDFEPGE